MSNYFDTFLAINPSDMSAYHKESLYATIEEQFDNANNVYEIKEEISEGTLLYNDIRVRISEVIDPKEGRRLGDDYRNIVFRNPEYQPNLGQRYFFDKRVWICYSTNNIKTLTSNAYLRACNNTMNFKLEDGSIYNEPCIIDWDIGTSMIATAENINVPKYDIVVKTQKNIHTVNIKINDRFLFNGTAYKVKEVNKSKRFDTFDKTSYKLIDFSLDYDNLSESDDVENDIAFNNISLPEVPESNRLSNTIYPDVHRILQGDSQSYSIYTYSNNVKQNTLYEIKAYDVTSLNYTLEIENVVDTNCGNVFSISNIKAHPTPLRIECKNKISNEIITFNIILGGVW